MSSHWTAIGFPEDTSEVYNDYAETGLDQGLAVQTPQGTYVCWQCGSGIEVWFQVYADDRVNLNPHFAGKTLITAQLTETFQRPDDSVLDGAFYGSAPAHSGSEPFDVPFLFDAPDYFVQMAGLDVPATVNIQLAAFAETLKIWPDEAAYFKEHSGERQLSPLSYFPVALPNKAEPYPVACASFGGTIEKARLLTNPITGLKFWRAQAKTLIGPMDLVADPSDIPGKLKAGQVFWGGFYLSGVILP